MRFVREQFYLAATVQNLKRLVRFLSYEPRQRSRLHERGMKKQRSE
jgi:hypothetical protein